MKRTLPQMFTIPMNLFRKRGTEHRLFIAYYYRTPTPSNQVRYHPALVVIPTPITRDDKSDMEYSTSEYASPSLSVPTSPTSFTFSITSPNVSSSNLSSISAPDPTLPNTAAHKSPKKTKKSKGTKFHVVDVPVNENGRRRVMWEYRVESEYLDTPAPHNRLRSRLASLMFVGNVASDNKVQKTLKKVQANIYADEFPHYLCMTWIAEVLSVLVNEKVIDPLYASPAEFWEIGAQYADKWRDRHGSHVVESEMEIPCCDRDGNEFPTPLGPSR